MVTSGEIYQEMGIQEYDLPRTLTLESAQKIVDATYSLINRSSPTRIITNTSYGYYSLKPLNNLSPSKEGKENCNIKSRWFRQSLANPINFVTTLGLTETSIVTTQKDKLINHMARFSQSVTNNLHTEIWEIIGRKIHFNKKTFKSSKDLRDYLTRVSLLSSDKFHPVVIMLIDSANRLAGEGIIRNATIRGIPIIGVSALSLQIDTESTFHYVSTFTFHRDATIECLIVSEEELSPHVENIIHTSLIKVRRSIHLVTTIQPAIYMTPIQDIDKLLETGIEEKQLTLNL